MIIANIKTVIFIKLQFMSNKKGQKFHRLSIQLEKQDGFETDIAGSITQFINKTNQSINLHKNLFKNNLPQRCQKHHNILTLYCQKDRFPICVSCLYHGAEHKNHKVIPLKNANKLLQTDMNNLQNKLESKVMLIEQILQTSTENIIQIERIHSDMINKIQNNFHSIYKMLEMKKNQQIQQLADTISALKKKHLFIIQQYQTLLDFFQKTTNSNPVDDEQTNLYKRNVLNIVTQNYSFIQLQVKKINSAYFTPILCYQQFSDIQNIICNKMKSKKLSDIFSFPIKHVDQQILCKSREISPLKKVSQNKEDNQLNNQQSISRYPLETYMNVLNKSVDTQTNRSVQKHSKGKSARKTSKTLKKQIQNIKVNDFTYN